MPPLNNFGRSAIALAVAQALFVADSNAATITVTSNRDDGTACTLREAIETFNEGEDQENDCVIDSSIEPIGTNDTILFDNSVSGEVVTLDADSLKLRSNVSINPGGEMTTIDANDESRVFEIYSGEFLLDHLVIAGGVTPSNQLGAGIRVTAGVALNISNSVITGNSADSGGGGIQAARTSTLVVQNSTFSNNYAKNFGGGLRSSGNTTVINSTFSNNTSYVGGGIDNGGTMLLSNVTINNSVGVPRIDSDGAAGIYNRYSLTMRNSIIANSTNAPNCLDFVGESFVIENSIFDDDSCADLDVIREDLELGALQDNGGATPTHALLEGSPAIDQGGINAELLDQRGFEAVDARDIGAFEFGASQSAGIEALDITVTSTGDSLDEDLEGCTLREAVLTVNERRDLDNGCFNTDVQTGIDMISFSPEVAGNTITLVGEQLEILNDVSINPDGINTTIDGGEQSRIMRIRGASVTADQLTLSNGNAGSSTGGGVYISAGSFSLSNSTMRNNVADFGGALFASASSVSLVNTTIKDNGGLEYGGGGIAVSRGELTTYGVTIEGNTSKYIAGGIDIGPGTVATIENTTISGNSSVTGETGLGGEYGGLVAYRGSTVALINSTIFGNSGSIANNLYVAGADSMSNTTSVSLVNTIVAGPDGRDCVTSFNVNETNPVVGGEYANLSLTAGADNIIQAPDANCVTTARNIDPQLASLANNGGPTMTHAIKSGSPALNTGTGVNPATQDQRGLPISGIRDAGAFESQPFQIEFDPSSIDEAAGAAASTATITRDAPFDLALTATLTSGDTNSVTVPATVDFDAGDPEATFLVAAVEEALDDGDTDVTIAAVATGLNSGSATIEVIDNDETLTLEFDTSNVDEDSFSTAANGTVTRTGPNDQALTVSLSNNGSTTLRVPATVVIPANSSSANFEVTTVDNDIAEGDRTDQITVSANNFGSASADLEVVDDDVPALELSTFDITVLESGSIEFNVSRNTPVDNSVAVSLSSSDAGLIDLPASIQIPAGAVSASFSVSPIDNEVINEEFRSVILTATGLTRPGQTEVIVIDDDDNDGDGVPNVLDNCPDTPNPDQADFEGDGEGDACDLDLDGDGLPNDYEEANGLNPLNSLDRDADPDGDGLTNIEEFELTSDPQVPDTDINENGIPDAVEQRTRRAASLVPVVQLLLLDES